MAQKTKRSAAKRSTSKRRGPRPAPRPAPGATWWGSLSEPVQHLVAFGFLVVVFLLFFSPALFSSNALIGDDTVRWRSMAADLIEYREATGEEALWAPNMFGGMPGYMISYPVEVPQLDTLVRVLNPVLWPLSIFLVLLSGAYLLVFFLTRDKLAAALAAAAYGLTTYLPILLVAGHNTKLVALCYAPWLVLAFAYALRRPTLLAGLLFAIALALNLRAKHIQITYYLAFLLGTWWLVEAVAAARARELKAFGLATLWLAVGSALAILMVAQPYWAQYEYKDFTTRGAAAGGSEGGMGFELAMAWSQGWGELFTLFIADAYGGGSGRAYWGPKSFTSGPHYLGGIVLALAAFALWQVRRRVVWALGLSALLMIFFSVGAYFPALNRFMYDVFPLFGTFRAPETWLSVVALALAVLAGLGLYALVRPLPEAAAAARRAKAAYVTLGSAAGLALVFVLVGSVFFSFERPGETAQALQQVAAANNVSPDDPRVVQAVEEGLASVRAERRDLFQSDALRTLIFLLLAGALVVAYQRRLVPAWAMQAGLVLLVVVDLWGVDRRYLSADDVDAESVEAEIPTYDFDRFILTQEEEAGGAGRFRVLSLERGAPMSMVTNVRPSYHYESIGGYHAAKLRLIQDFIEHIYTDPETGLPNENALDLLSTRFVVSPQPLPGLEVAYQGEETGLYVLENPDALPRGFFVGETEVIEEAEATWARLRSPSFDPSRTAILAEPLEADVTPIDSASTAQATLERFTPREIQWQLETDAPRLFVASEIYYPAGWTATLDGEEVPIVRADYLLRAVPVPAGTHTLTMRFDPPAHTLGVWISGVSTVLVYGGVLLLLGLSWRRRQSEEVVERDA